MIRSGTETHYGNEVHYCRKCDQPINWCICIFEKSQFPKIKEKYPIKIVATKYNFKKVPIFPRKLLNSTSGIKGVKLLKRLNKI